MRDPDADSRAGYLPLLPLAIYSVGSGVVLVFQRYLTFHFDSLTQNFFRFLVGAGCMLLLSAIWHREGLRHLLGSRRGMAGVGLVVVFGLVAQTFAVEGLARTSAALGALIALLGAPLTLAGSALFFAEERPLLRGRRFWVGAALALGGAVALAWPRAGADVSYSTGVWYLLTATGLGVGLGLLGRALVREFCPLCVGTLTTWGMCAGFFLLGLRWGHFEQVGHVPPLTVAILLFSGAFGLLLGSALYNICLQRLGLVRTRFSELATPVFAGLIGYAAFRETVTPLQALAGAAVLLGCALAIVRPITSAMPTSAPAE